MQSDSLGLDDVRRANAGRLQLELFMVLSRANGSVASLKPRMDDHNYYLAKLERASVLFLSGPLINEDCETWSGDELMVLRAADAEEAKRIAQEDPLHSEGLRSFTVRPWFINEGGVTLSVRLSDLSLSVQ